MVVLKEGHVINTRDYEPHFCEGPQATILHKPVWHVRAEDWFLGGAL